MHSMYLCKSVISISMATIPLDWSVIFSFLGSIFARHCIIFWFFSGNSSIRWRYSHANSQGEEQDMLFTFCEFKRMNISLVLHCLVYTYWCYVDIIQKLILLTEDNRTSFIFYFDFCFIAETKRYRCSPLHDWVVYVSVLPYAPLAYRTPDMGYVPMWRYTIRIFMRYNEVFQASKLSSV